MAPALEMLWETQRPEDVLRDRFGLADAHHAAAWVAGILHDRYGVTMTGCERVVLSDHNALVWTDTDRGHLIVKWCVKPDRFERLRALAQLTAWCADRGLPVSAPLSALDGSVQLETDAASVGVQRVIAGQLLDVSDDNLVRSAGAALARLHESLRVYPLDEQPLPLSGPAGSLKAQITDWMVDPPAHLPAAAVALLRSEVDALPDTPMPVQVVHGDYRSANILCARGEVTAVLDFEEARIDHPIAELARSAVLLGTQFHDWGPVDARTRDLLRDGYESVRSLDAVESAWWGPLILWWSLMFVPTGADPMGWTNAATALVTARDIP